MGRFVTWVVLVAACGKVGEAPAVAIADAALDAFSCAAPQLACGGSCVDPTSDPSNCGGCGIACQAGLEACQAGACVDTAATCADIHAGNPTATDGPYQLLNGTMLNCAFSGTCAQVHVATPSASDGIYMTLGGSAEYCDMTDGGQNIYGLAYGQFSVATAGYAMVTLPDYQSPGLQQVFLSLFNQQGGANLIASWSIGDCCIKVDATARWLQLGTAAGSGSWVDDGLCQAATPAVAGIGVFVANTSGQPTAQTPPLPANFFSTYPPTTTTSICSDGANPAYFWKETP
jgi:hypothetical protein